MHARSSTHGNGVWKSTDAGKTWTKIGLEKSYFIPKVEVDSKNPDIVYVAAEGKLYDNEMDCERGLYKSTDGGKTWTNICAPDQGPRRGRLRHRPAQLRRHHRRGLQDLPPRLDLHRPPARQRPLQDHRRRQDLEEADERACPQGLALGRTGPGHLREEPEHRLRPGRRGSEPRLPGARRRRQLPRAGGRRARRRSAGAAALAARPTSGRTRRFRRSRPSSSTRCSSKRPAQVHAVPGREGSRLRQEAQRGDRRQGLPDEERHRPREVHAGGAQDATRRTRRRCRRSTSSRSWRRSRPRRRLDRRQGALPDHQPPRPRDALRGRARRTCSRRSAAASSTAATTRARPGRR